MLRKRPQRRKEEDANAEEMAAMKKAKEMACQGRGNGSHEVPSPGVGSQGRGNGSNGSAKAVELAAKMREN